MKIQISYDKSCPTLDFAAGEVRSYLSRMLPEEGTLSITLAAADTGEDIDSFAVSMTEEGGTFTGNSPRAVLLGIYHYLRRLGCRFLTPGREHEIVPAIERNTLADCCEKRASFRHRGVCIEGADSIENIVDFIDWLPKVGYNSFFLQFKSPYAFLKRWYHHERNPMLSAGSYTPSDAERDMELLEAEVKKRGLFLHKVGHGWTGETLGYQALSWDADAQPLSEEKRPMAAQVNGVRELHQGVPANTNLCFSNEMAVDAFAAQVVEYARAHPAADCLHVWLADEYNNVCECPSCQTTTLSDQYVELLNEIDRRLTAEGLETRIVFLLYQELLWPPIQARLNHPERFILMFAPISRTFETSYQVGEELPPIPAYVRNRVTLPTDLRENLAFLRGWQQIFQGDSFVYDYPLGRAHYGDLGYVHIARVISADIKKLRLLGLDGYISCQELRAGLPNFLPNYVMGCTLLDETGDAEKLLSEYFQAAYGPDWEKARDYLSRLSRLSSCDYLNGKGERTDPEMARRMAELQQVCRDFAPTLQKNSGGLWPVLAYHQSYALALARALELLAQGKRRESGAAWQSLRNLVCENELKFQPFLDVYRVLEVTEKYTGFSTEA